MVPDDVGSLRDLPARRRRAVRLHEAGVQLRLPLYLLLATAAFGALFAVHTRAAYADLYAMLLSAAPASFGTMVAEQMAPFLRVSVILIAAWILAVLCICVGYTQRLIGPTVALRRQIQALKRGNTAQRVQVRRHDRVFGGLAEDLNELTYALSVRTHDDARPQPVTR